MSTQSVRPDDFLRTRNREVSVWLDEYDTNQVQLQQPVDLIYESRFARADREWRDIFAYESSAPVTKTQPCHQVGGEPLRCYQINGYLIIETAKGSTVRPVRRKHNEARFFEHPISTLPASRNSAIQIFELLSTASHHLQRSRQAVGDCHERSRRPPASPLISRVTPVEYVQWPDCSFNQASQALITHWVTLRHVLKQLESYENWTSIYRFCQHKSRFCLSRAVCVTSDDVGKAYSGSSSEISGYTGVDVERITALVSALSEDLSFITNTVANMIEKTKPVDGASTTTLSDTGSRSSTSTSPCTQRRSSQTPITDVESNLDEEDEDSSSAYQALFDALADTALPAPAPPPSTTKKRPIISRPVLQYSRNSSLAASRFSLDRPLRSISGRLTGSRWKAWIPNSAPWQGSKEAPQYRSVFAEMMDCLPSDMDVLIAEGRKGVWPGTVVRGGILEAARLVVPPRGRVSVVSLPELSKIPPVDARLKRSRKVGKFQRFKPHIM